jgi:demethylmenaquinone methyltransferase/2-methoxy-6-polyprenyl-1,4-benzoquinol methylase
MLDEGKKKLDEKGYSEAAIKYQLGNALTLPYPNNHFDIYTVSFGLRNMVDFQKALNEAYRVLKQSGRIYILDLSRIQNPTFKALYDLYTLKLFGPISKMLFEESKQKHYQYLGESAPTFLNQEELRSYMVKAGFTKVDYRNLNNGIVCLHQGIKA